MVPLFMWAGGKTKLIKKYENENLLPQNFSTYVEPFFGGGAMFIWAKKKCPNANFIINDKNNEIINIYKSIQSDCEYFLEALDQICEEYLEISSYEDRKDFYYMTRNNYAWNESLTDRERAPILYFMLKTSFNGIWQINKNTNNKFGTPFGLGNQKIVYDKQNVYDWNAALVGVKIMSNDFRDFMNTLNLDEDTFIFVDPPYRDSFCKYGEKFLDNDQIDVLEIAKAPATVLISNKECFDGFWEKNWGGKIHRFSTTYTAGRRKKSIEDGTFSAYKAEEVLLDNR